MKRFLYLVLLISQTVLAQKVIRLYDGPAPGSEKWNWEEKQNNTNMIKLLTVYNVVNPTLTVYPPDPGTANGTAVIVCPGGGFHFLSIETEGIDVAKWLAKKGVTAFVLKYRTAHVTNDDPFGDMINPARREAFEKEMQEAIPFGVADGRVALTYVRKHAADFGVSPSKVGIIGFSAGGTVSSSSGYKYSPENKPDFLASIYPYMPASLQSEILPDAPPLFLVCASDDQLGLTSHSLDLYAKWLAAKKPVEMHLYEKGGHGFGMRVQNIPTDQWIDRFGEWLKLHEWIK